MPLKDYYTILELPPDASLQQIKKAFRKLAHRYHPDKNPGNAMAEACFKEVQEAYAILGSTAKREEYHYKRWYNKSSGKNFSSQDHTPAGILTQCLQLKHYLETVNAMRVDYDVLSHHIRQLLNDAHIQILQQYNDKAINTRIIETLTSIAVVLPYRYTEPITGLLLKAAGNDTGARSCINAFGRQQQQKGKWQKYRLAIVAAITLFLCWLIYLLGK